MASGWTSVCRRGKRGARGAYFRSKQIKVKGSGQECPLHTHTHTVRHGASLSLALIISCRGDGGKISGHRVIGPSGDLKPRRIFVSLTGLPQHGSIGFMAKARYHYNIMLRPEPEGGYTALVPALPGCVTYGRTVDEAREMAKDAISGYIASLRKHKVTFPI